MTTILGVGAYAPRSFITSETFADAWGRHRSRGIDQCAIPDADEDSLTMAWEAATRALTAADKTPESVVHLSLATTTPPVAEEDLIARLASMLGVPPHARLSTVTGSSRAGTDALCAGLDAGPWPAGDVGLVVAADAPRGAHDDAIGQAAGAGAAALVLGAGDGGDVTARAHAHTAAPGERYRRPGETTASGLGITAYDRDVFQQVVTDVVESLAFDLDEIDAAAIHAHDGKRPYRLAGPLGIDPSVLQRGTTVHNLGYTGAAGVPLGIATALDDNASVILAVGYGAGATVDAFVIDADNIPVETAIHPDIELEYPAALRRRGDLGGDEPAGGGAYVSMPAWRRSLPQRHRLEGRRCSVCGSITIGADGACPDCSTTDRFEPVRLAGTGTVEAVTTIGTGGAPPEFEAYQTRAGSFQTAIIAFDGPEDTAVSLPAMVVATDEVEVGDSVDSVVRRIYTQEGVPRYGRKVSVNRVTGQ